MDGDFKIILILDTETNKLMIMGHINNLQQEFFTNNPKVLEQQVKNQQQEIQRREKIKKSRISVRLKEITSRARDAVYVRIGINPIDFQLFHLNCRI